MTLEYNVNKDKDAVIAYESLKSMCRLMKKEEEINTEGRPRKRVLSKYLCPCGTVDVVSDKMGQPDVHTVLITSDKCGI